MSAPTGSDPQDGSDPAAGSDATAGEDVRRPAPPPVAAVLGPLPVWAVTAIVGALLGELIGERLLAADVRTSDAWRWGWALVGLLAAAMITTVAAGRGTSRSGSGATAGTAGPVGVILVLSVCVIGTVLRIATVNDGLLPDLARQGGVRELSATVVHEPRPIATGWSVLVRVDEVDGEPTRERAALTLDDPPPALGSRWDARASARPLPDGGYGRWLSRQHATVLLDVVSWEAQGDPGHLAAVSEHVRERIRVASTRHLSDRTGGLLVGFVTGDTRLLPDADAEAMRATGLTHLTAVSGANVAILIGGVLLVVTLLRIPAVWRRRTISLTVIWFAFLTRFEPSVLRAGSMALLVLLVAARGVPRDARHALAGAVLLLVLIDPRLAGSLGLLLSATATAGVLVVAPLVRERLPRMPRRLADVASISIGAQVAVVPLLLATFGEVPVASVPANIVAVPAAAIAAVLSFTGSVLALVHLELGAPLFAIAGLPARVVLWSAHTFAGVGGTAELARPATVVALLGSCLWLLSTRQTRTARLAVGITIAGLIAAGLPLVMGGLSPAGFTVTAIDVGQGDAFLIESPSARVLVDAGEDDTAARWLRANGRRHLDVVVVTHPHLDHIGGVPDVLRAVRVDVVWFHPVPTQIPHVEELFEVAEARDIPVRTPHVGDNVVVGDLHLEVLHPPSGRPYRWARSELNETSIVARVHHGDRRVLITGDVEVEAQTDLLAGDAARLRAELLLVPHHGAGTSVPAFFDAVDPLVGVISAGVENRHGHPHPETITSLEERGIQVRRTDLEGTLRVVVPDRSGRPRGRSLQVGSRYDSRAAHLRRRRSVAAAGTRAPTRRAARRRPRVGRRSAGCLGARTVAGAADHVALRRPYLRGAARCGDRQGRPEGRGGELPGRPVR